MDPSGGAPTHDLPLRAALRVGVVYVAVAGVWIAWSDRVLAALAPDLAQLTLLQTWKGGIFVLVSGLLLVALVHREVARSRRSEERFRTLVEQTLVGVYIIRGGRFVYANPRLAEIFGYGQEELTASLKVDDVVAPEDRDRVGDNLRRQETGDADGLRYRFRGRRADGEEIEIEAFGRSVDLEGGPAVMGVLLERTEEARLEQQLHRAQRMEAIGQLTGAVAHDFNNLLTAMIAPLDLCIQGAGDDPVRAELLEVRATAERAATLTRQLLAFSRKQVDHPVVLDLTRTLVLMEPMLSRLLPPSVSLRVIEPEGEHRVRVDPSGLEQVIMNLVVNARDAMPRGGEITVRVHEVGPEKLRRRDDPDPGVHVCLEVQDTGHGMDEPTRLRIFEPFFTTKEGGTGLGLATVFGRVKKAGGFVRVKTAPGRGTTFSVFLPRATALVPPVERERPAFRLLTGKERVLVVEDDDRVRAVTAAALERVGYSVVAVADVDAAFEVARPPGPPVDLLLTDVRLRGGTGPALARSLLALRPDLRVLFMSGYSDEEATAGMDDLEGFHFLSKPFSLEDLTGKVEEALELPSLRVKDRTA